MKLLILYASAGAGHRRAAEALAEEAGVQGCEAILADILDFTPPLFRRTYAKGYLELVRTLPELWGYLYAQADRTAQHPHRRMIRTVFNRLNTFSFLRFYRRQAPDAAVCTHFMPLEILSARRREDRPSAPLYGVLTDFDMHAMWLCRNVDRYFASTEDAARHLIRRGQPADRVMVTGIPVLSAFRQNAAPAATRGKLGLDPDLPAVLVLAGGFGVGPAAELVRAFEGRAVRCQMVVVAGRNEEMRRECEQAARSVTQPVRVLGFVENVHELMDSADLVATKPGGLSSSEALAKGKPLLLLDPIPGQEQRNAEYLLESGAAVRLIEAADAPDKIGALLAEPARLRRLARQARALGRPQAARDIIRLVRESCLR